MRKKQFMLIELFIYVILVILGIGFLLFGDEPYSPKIEFPMFNKSGNPEIPTNDGGVD
jgi:hypothetical protein